MPVTTRSTVSEYQTNARTNAQQSDEYLHNEAARKLLNALRRLAREGLDRKVTLSVRLNHDGVSIHAQVPMSEPEDVD